MEFLDNIIFDNSVRDLLVVLGVILFMLIFRSILSRYIASLIYTLIKRRWRNVPKPEFLSLIIKPLGWFMVILVSVFAIDRLVFPGYWNITIYGLSTEMILNRIGASLICVYFIWVLLSFINFFSYIFEQRAKATADQRDDQVTTFLRDFLKAIVYILGILLILKVGFNRNIGALLTGLSIVGAALALAAKESIENLIASFIIFFDKPFFAGDVVKVNNVTGSVEHIGLRSTRIRTADKTLVTVPNKQMVDSIVDNLSMRTNFRAEIRLEFVTSSEAESIKKLMDEAKSFLSSSHDVTGSSVFVSDFNKTAITVFVEFFTIPFKFRDFAELRQNFHLRMKSEVEKLGLKMVPGQEINIFQDQSPVTPPNRPII